MSEAIRYSLRTQLTDLLPRLRQTLPLPVDPVRIYKGAFGPQVAQWFVGRVPTALHHRSVAYRNLLRATARQDIIHFNLTVPDKIDDWSDRNPDQPFWIRMADAPVCPVSKLNPFLLEEDVRNDPLLQEWYRKADLMETELRYFHDLIYRLAPLFASRNDIALAWPEAVRAVPAIVEGRQIPPVRATASRISHIKERMQNIITYAEKAKLSDLLATAVMLPSDFKLMAWIGTNREEDLK